MGMPSDEFARITQEFVAEANRTPGIANVFTTFQPPPRRCSSTSTATRRRCCKVPVTNIFEAMRVFMGSAYVNDFNMFGRTYRVTAQADGDFRLDPESIAIAQSDGLWAEFGDDRVIDTPLTESMIVGASIGAAINGLRPVAEIQFADFIFPAFNQIVSEAARMRYRSNGGFGVPMVIRAPYGGGVHGALYHSQSVEAFFTHVRASRSSSRRRRTTRAGLLRLGDPRRRPGAVLRAQEDVPLGPRRRARRRLHGAARQGAT